MIHKIQSFIRALVFWLFTSVVITLVCIFSLLTLGIFTSYTVKPICKWWSSVSFRIMGLKIKVDGQNNLMRGGKGVFLFNHTSTLDLFVGAYCMPYRGLPIGKKEIMYIPFINVAWWAFGFGFLNRGKGAKSIDIFNKYSERVFRKNRVLVAAPEGTRSRTGETLPFKKGSFFAAMNAKAPIQFLVILNAFDIWPTGRTLPKSGSTVEAKILPAIKTDDWTLENIEEKITELRSQVIKEIEKYRRSHLVFA